MQRPRWTKVRAGLDRYTSTLIDRFRSPATTTNRLRRRAGIAMPEALEPRIVLDSTVVFNEIMFHPDTDEETREWIELHNQMSVDIDLSGWRLSGGVKFDFADGTVLGGGDYLVIAASPEDLIAETGLPASAVLGPLDGRLDNAGETLRLRNRNNRIMDEIKYGDNDPWPPGADGGGVSLAKLNPNSGTEQISNWTISQQVGGTPGTTNFPGPPGPADLIFETVVPTGAPVKALVPSDGGLGTTWTARGFNDGTWTSGTTGVGFDSATTYDPFLGLDLDDPPNGQPPIRVSNNATVYMRVPFEFNSNPQQFDSIVLRMRYDDGFVAYINGVEVAHRLAPGRDGNNDPLVWNSRATANHIDGQAVVFEDFEITQFRSAFVQGAENVLAIHGLNNGTGSTDLLFQPELVVGRLPGVPVSFDGGALKLNEVAPASAEEFWLELSNDSDQPLELGGVVIVTSGVGGEYVLPNQTLSVGGLLLLTEQDLGFHPADGDKLFVYPPNKQAILDARVVTNRLRGRADEYPDRWLWPNVATRGAANRFDFEDQIVINEIMYHAAPQFETDAQPFAENDEEWVELYNRGSAQVDLAGWKLDDAMEFDFPIGTVLKPGEYLVVAKDAAALSAKYPGIAIVGDFSRSLSNSDDRILLVDANKNPADEVHYFERGKWAESADGGGSTLELRDPDADNNNAAAWAASDEAGRSSWQHYTYTRTVTAFPFDPPINFQEFIFGLLDVGEVLLDNVSVIESPGGANRQLIQNGSFEADAVGGTANKWRIQGTHNESRVIDDPNQPGNQVLRLVATGKAHYLSNHAETTLAGGARVVNGRTYRISYDAKWITGTPQLRTELFHKDAAKTTILRQPTLSGTPGARNSTFEANLGPTYEGFIHSPVIPTSNQGVTVSVAAADGDGIASMTLRYRINGAGTTRGVAMALGSDGLYRATMPAQSNGTVVQFYVEGRDTLGAVSTFPAAGADSRALLKVDNNFNRDSLRHDVQIIMTPADTSALHLRTNMMHNNRYGSTFVYDGQQVFYDVGTRLKGSMFTRNSQSGTGYNVRFDPDEKFRGVHENLTFDQKNEQEIVVKHLSVQAGLMGAMYDDVVFFKTPSGSGGGPTPMSMARHGDVFLESQFDNGSDGTVFKFEGIRVMTSTANGTPEALKIYQPIGWVGGFDVANLGDDKEVYRWPYLILNNRARDDYTQIIAMAKAMSLSGTALENAVAEVLDVDQWAQTFAMMSLTGIGDAYSQGNPHNLNFYVRPEDNKVLAFPWDWDFAFSQSTSAPLHGGKNIGDVLNRPVYQRLLYGHMLEMIDTVFNTAYMNTWLSHYGTMLGRGFSYSGNISNRGSFVTSSINSRIRPVDFHITTNSGNPITVDDNKATIAGDGWVDVREIRLAGSKSNLDVTWTDNNSWSIALPVAFGENNPTFEAYDYRGNLIGSDSILITSTDPGLRVADVLRLSEVMYNPADPPSESIYGNDQFEFIELVNISDETIDLRGVEFNRGVTFSFTGSNVESLAAGARVVVVRNELAFAERYADPQSPINIAGEYIGKLDNGGERLVLVDSLGQAAFDFSYNDRWHGITDGDGFSLTVRDTGADPASLAEKSAWRPSTLIDGTPGSDRAGPVLGDVVINEILTHTDDSATGDWIELFNTTDNTINLSGWYLSDSGDNLRKFRIPDGTLIPGGGYVTFDQFGNGERVFGENSLLVDPLGNPGAFGLSELGDALRLTLVDPTRIRENIDAVHVIDENRIILSTAGSAVLGSNALSFRDGDLVQYDRATGIASLVFSESVFLDPSGLRPSSEDIDAVSVLTGGDFVLSTAGSARIGELPFRDGDLVRYDPTTGVATLLISKDLFTSGGDINAVHVVEVAGQIERYVISTNGPVTIDGVLYDDGDLIEIVPGPTSDLASGLLGDGTVRRFLAESVFAVGGNSSGDPTESIDAVFLGAGGSLALSTNSGAAFAGRLDEAFQNGDVMRLTPGAGSDLAGGNIGTNAQLELLFAEVPETGTTFYGEAAGYREKVDFAAAEREVTFGIYTKTDGLTDFVAMVNPTKGQANGDPRVGPIVFNEVMYNPSPDGDSGGLEFIELLNISDSPVDLFDSQHPENTWAFTSGIGFTFPQGVTLRAGGLALVVPVDEATFRATHSVPADVRVLGPYISVLDNGGEKIALSRPGEPEPNAPLPMIEVVRLDYDDVSPWPTQADGEGWSLQLKQTGQYGNDPDNWGITIPGGTAGDFVVAPRVSEVLLWGSGWSQEMLDRLASDGLGSGGASIPGGPSQLQTVAWSGVDRVSIRFTEDVNVESSHLKVLGVDVAEYGVVGFGYDRASRTATWSLSQSPRSDKLRLVLNGDVTDLSNLPLDGDWADGADAFPSGNGAVDSNDDFRFRVNVLAGDVVPGDGIDRRDLIEIIHHLGGSTADNSYDPRLDINADGQIDTADLRAVLLRHGTDLPTGEPRVDPGGSARVAIDAVFGRLGAAASPAQAIAGQTVIESDAAGQFSGAKLRRAGRKFAYQADEGIFAGRRARHRRVDRAALEIALEDDATGRLLRRAASRK